VYGCEGIRVYGCLGVCVPEAYEYIIVVFLINFMPYTFTIISLRK
jgi:hypothetical protein